MAELEREAHIAVRMMMSDLSKSNPYGHVRMVVAELMRRWFVGSGPVSGG